MIMTIDKIRKVQEKLHKEEMQQMINKMPSYKDIFSDIKKLLMNKAALYRILIGQVSIEWSKTLEKLLELEMELNEKRLSLQKKLIK